MKFLVWPTTRIVGCGSGDDLHLIASPHGPAALGFGDDDDNSEEEGPSYFGFVKDTSGATIPDAKVTVGIKNRGGIVTRTDALGTYKVPGFGKEIDPKDVEVACDKPGYKQLRVVRRSSPSTDPKIPIETECTLQRI